MLRFFLNVGAILGSGFRFLVDLRTFECILPLSHFTCSQNVSFMKSFFLFGK